MGIPRMITIIQASKESGYSYDAIRKLCLDGKIVYRKIGKKYMINAEKFGQYLNGEDVEEEGTTPKNESVKEAV